MTTAASKAVEITMTSLQFATGAYTLTVDTPGSAFMAPLSTTSPTAVAARTGGRKPGRHAE